jgi:hypothetical protein
MITGILPLIAIALEDDKPEVLDFGYFGCVKTMQCCCMMLDEVLYF